MQNVELSVNGDILTIKIDLTANLGPSSTGKSIKIASTAGNKPIPGFDGTFIGLNVYRKP